MEITIIIVMLAALGIFLLLGMKGSKKNKEKQNL